MRHHTRITFVISLFLFSCIIISSIIVNYNLGFYNWIEPETYLRFYLQEGSIVDKMFNYIRNDIQQIYRARELSNLFNYLDAELLVLLARAGLPNLLSPVHYLTILTIPIIHLLCIARRSNRTVVFVVALLSCVYLTVPSVFLPLEYFRTAKVLVSAGISFFILFLFSVSKKQDHTKKSYIFSGIWCTVITIGIGLLDEFGMLFSGLFVAFFVLQWLHKKQSHFLAIALGILVGLALLWLYRNLVGPTIAGLVTGIQPQLWTISGEAANPNATWLAAIKQFFTYIRHFFGNLPTVLSWIPMVLFFFLAYWARKKTLTSRLARMQAIFFVGGFFLVAVVTVYLMSLKVPTITSLDSALVYYALPWHTFWYTMLCLLAITIPQRLTNIVYVLVVVWLGANIMALPFHIKSLTTGDNREYFGIALTVIEGIRSPTVRPYGKFGDETTLIFHKRLYNKEWQY